MSFLLLLLLLLLTISSGAEAKSITVGVGGVSLHGLGFEEETSKFMPNKVDNHGYLVTHSELSITARYDDWQFTGNMLRDSFDMPATMMGAGLYYPIGNFSFGWIAGIYTRKTFTKDQKEGNHLVHYEAPPMPGGVQVGDWQYHPMLMGTASYFLPIYKRHGIELNIGSNLILTHGTLGYSYNF